MTKRQIAEQILRGLESQKFADWYGDGGTFEGYISGDAKYLEKLPTKETILRDIEKMFLANV